MCIKKKNPRHTIEHAFLVSIIQSISGKIAQIKDTFHKDNFSWEHAFSPWREVDLKASLV